MERLISVSSRQSDNVGKIIDKVFNQHYPDGNYIITLDDLLNWDMWQIFIKIYDKLHTL